LDEPFSGLDLVIKTRLIKEIAALARERELTVLLVTHDPLDAATLCRFAILLEEEGLLDKALIYATDFNPSALEKAKSGIFEAVDIQQYTENFHKVGGKGPFSRYFSSQYRKVMMEKRLKSRIVFSEHNLVTDTTFSEVHAVVCRNVLIYFNRKLQDKVLEMFKGSLVRKGFLCLGAKESLCLSDVGKDFEQVKDGEKVYRRKN